MDNSRVVYLKYNEARKKYCNLRDSPTVNSRHDLGYKCSTIFFNDGIRRSRKLFAINGTKHAAKTHKIEKRNERERYRVQAVNDAFCRLRRLIPAISTRRKRISKVKTLKKAVEYIIQLQTILQSPYL